MLLKQINRSPDITKLRNEGYEVELIGDYLLVHSVPYLNSKKEVAIGTLVSNVSIAQNMVTRPNTHVVYFIGEMPCNKDGVPIPQIQHQSRTFNLTDKIIVNHSFSNKPRNGYANYYDKMTQYVKIISAPAKYINPQVTAKTFKIIKSEEQNSVFNYFDTNSSRSKIDFINHKLSGLKIGIVGLGGTGSYILDFVSKTPVAEIHLIDGDKFLQHNAFRAPGAASVQDLERGLLKVTYYQQAYSKMHKHIVAHSYFLNSSNVGCIKGLDFVFVCIDRGNDKKILLKKLIDLKIPFVDTGIGVEVIDDALRGAVRTTTGTEQKNDHILDKRISFHDAGEDDYTSNIQISEINALNAVLAVIRWKKLFGFYVDMEREFNSTYCIDTNQLTSDEIEA